MSNGGCAASSCGESSVNIFNQNIRLWTDANAPYDSASGRAKPTASPRVKTKIRATVSTYLRKSRIAIVDGSGTAQATETGRETPEETFVPRRVCGSTPTAASGDGGRPHNSTFSLQFRP